MIRPLAVAITLTFCVPSIGWAQRAKPAAAPLKRGFDLFLLERLAILKSGATADKGTDAKQVAAPAASASSDTAVDAPSFATVLGLAIDNDLIGVKDGALTASVTPFAFKALARPRILSDGDLYSSSQNSFLRRIGGSVTVGGKGEKVDRDGDGKADDARTAGDLTDIVTTELRYRFRGVRDRQDSRTIPAYLSFKAGEQTLDQALSEVAGDIRAIRGQEWFKAIADLRRPCTPGDPDLCFFDDSIEEIDAILKELHDAGTLKTYEEHVEKAIKMHGGSVKQIDRSAEWSVVGGFTRQGADFGPNRRHLGLRGLFPVGVSDHTFNLDWTQAESRTNGTPDATSIKAAYQIARTFQTNGVKFSYSAAWERYRHVPRAKHDSVARTGVKFEIPITDSVTLPLSITWANHRDLLTDQSVLKGHVGLAWDFSGLTKKKKDKLLP